MKFSAALVAAATASPTSFIAQNWWTEAVNVFNFAQNNWNQFAATVNSVDDSYWAPLWQFCNADGNDFITANELTQCAAEAANYVGMSDATQNFLYDFGVKYWDVVDYDNDGALNYDEYKYTMAAFAAVDARVIVKAFDANADGVLADGELTAWLTFVQGALAENGWNPSDEDKAALKAAWADAQVDGDDNSASLLEISKFVVGAWNVLLD